jgi:signal transduction histidine kinase
MLATIAEASRASVSSMGDIVWSINPERDSVLEMTRKMREHAEEICEPHDIRVVFDPGETFVQTRLDMQLRRELFLIFKESVNNAVRHSGCTELTIDFSASGHEVMMSVQDNGRGFESGELPQGNGLNNMKNRAGKLGGQLSIKSHLGSGTVIFARVPK